MLVPTLNLYVLMLLTVILERFVEFVKQFRELPLTLLLLLAMLLQQIQTQELILNGADIVKVGIGPGSVCTTYVQNWRGISLPPLSVLMALVLMVYITLDGGCT